MANKVSDTHGCYVVPAFTGLGAPHWDQYARGTIVGITRGVNKYHIIRATLESIAYQVNDVLNAMKADSGINLAALKVDGGASANNFLMQTQADIINAPVNRPCCVETTAMGAAYLAGLAVGYWSSKEEVRHNWSIDQKFYPSISKILYGAVPAPGAMVLFCVLLGIFAIGAPGVPGGTVMASLGIITGILKFGDSATALMLTIFALQDSFGTACNVTGDGALTLILTGYARYHNIREQKLQ